MKKLILDIIFLNKEDQAKYIGVQGAFYNVAKLVANGGLVALAEKEGHIDVAEIDHIQHPTACCQHPWASSSNSLFRTI